MAFPGILRIVEVERKLDIAEVLNRRSDLSTFVVHLTRDHSDTDKARDRLEQIIAKRNLRAGEPRGMAVSYRPKFKDALTDEQKETQRVVCFTETPLEHVYSMFAEIASRVNEFRPYGLGLTKMVARRAQINPVWYVDLTDPSPWPLRNALNSVIDHATKEGWFEEAKAIFPMIELMYTRRDDEGTVMKRNEWWWEREWRHVGDVDLVPLWDKILWFSPEEEITDVERLVREAGGDAEATVHCVDPNWGLERIIGRLMGLTEDDLTPFGVR
jgi:hypothetical protein